MTADKDDLIDQAQTVLGVIHEGENHRAIEETETLLEMLDNSGGKEMWEILEETPKDAIGKTKNNPNYKGISEDKDSWEQNCNCANCGWGEHEMRVESGVFRDRVVAECLECGSVNKNPKR